jgi:TRAF3-interacting protein 1
MAEPWIEETQKTLGTLITKPKLGEKYLKKPPFRFLHDALVETIRATGFGQGLYNESELDPGNIQDKQAKLDFLNKMISCVSFALGEKLDVSANKIVAGLEPEKTNAFLVKIYDAATTKLDSSPDAVKRVTNGETVAAKKEKKVRRKKDEEKRREEDLKRLEESGPRTPRGGSPRTGLRGDYWRSVTNSDFFVLI